MTIDRDEKLVPPERVVETVLSEEYEEGECKNESLDELLKDVS